MKLFLILLTMCYTSSFGQTFNTDTTLSGTYNANGGIMYINAKISGNVTISNAIIVANSFTQIFDTTVTIGSNVYIREFSAAWFGAKPSNPDNATQLQRSIDQCKDRYSLYIPSGSYTTSRPLLIAKGSYGAYQQTSIKMYGEASFWDNGTGTKIVYTGNECAIGLQLNKGTEISHLVISGGWVSPTGTDTVYFNIPYASYTNQSATGNGVGLWIDTSGNWNQRSGSTGCYFHDLKIEKFQTLIQISNSIVQNGEIMRFNNIQLGNAKVGIQCSQAQEKVNVFDGIYSWGSIHTLFQGASGAGNYFISNVNVAGHCIRLFNINSTGYFPTHISNIYAENFLTIGFLYSTQPMNILNCHFDFIVPQYVGNADLVFTNSAKTKFENCIFRYYGQSVNMKFNGAATYENCFTSGTVTGATGSTFITYNVGSVNTGTSIQVNSVSADTIRKSNVNLSLRRSYKSN